MDAADEGARKIMGLLIKRGADLELRDPDGMSALDIVDFEGDKWDVAKILIRHGAIRNPKLKTRQDELNEYYDARERLQSTYFDDRVYIYDISFGLYGSLLSVERKETWSVIARRNVHRYPPVSIWEFSTYDEAIEYLRKIAPTTPRVSLGKQPPDPVPSWEEYQQWVDEIEAAPRRQKELALLLKWPKPRTYNKLGKRQRYSSSSPPCLQERALRAAIRRRLDKPRKGERRLSSAPLHPMVRLVPAKPRSIRNELVCAANRDLTSTNNFRMMVRPIRRDLLMENPRRTLPPRRLSMIPHSEATIAIAVAMKARRKHKGAGSGRNRN